MSLGKSCTNFVNELFDIFTKITFHKQLQDTMRIFKVDYFEKSGYVSRIVTSIIPGGQ